MKKYNYSVIPDPILQICEHSFILKGILIHLGSTGNNGHYVYVTFSNNGNKISGIYNNQLVGLFKPDKFIYFNFIVKNDGIPETSLPTINTDPQMYTAEINSIKENVEKNGYIYLYEKIDTLEEDKKDKKASIEEDKKDILEEDKKDREEEDENFTPSEIDTESWFKKLWDYLRFKKWFEELLDRMKRQESQSEEPIVIPTEEVEKMIESKEPTGKSCKDFFIKLFPIWLKKQDKTVIDKTTEYLEKYVTIISNKINQEQQGTKYLKAISTFLNKPRAQPLLMIPNNFEQSVLDGIILAKNILNISFEKTVTKNELRNNANKLLYIIENNNIPNSNDRKNLIKIAYQFLIEIPENLTKMPPILQLQYNNNQNEMEMKRREREKKEREIKAFLLKTNWQNLKKILDIMNASKYKELNLKDTTIVLRSRIHNKTMKHINNNSICMKYKSGNICKEIGELTPIIITQRGYPSQIRKLTRKARLEIVDKNVEERKEKERSERENVENKKITSQLQDQIKILENLKEKVNIINNEDVKKQIDFYTRRLNDLNETLLDPDEILTDADREEIANILTKTIKIQKVLQEKLLGGKRSTRKKIIKNK